jgi:hypothetical protein
MATRKTASVLLLLAAIAGIAHAQFMQPLQPLPGMPAMAPFQPLSMPEGAQVATASAVANGPGSSSSFASNNNGVTSGYTQSTGAGNYASAGTSGPDARGCQVINQASSGGCPNGGTNCCSTTEKVERCGPYTTAVASVNGNYGVCCITLQRISDKTPQLFCAAPTSGRNYFRMPANVEVDIKPSCASELSRTGSVSCTVAFPRGLPQGFTYPAGFSERDPLALYANRPFAGFQPCLGGKFQRFLQAVSREAPVVLTSKCE